MTPHLSHHRPRRLTGPRRFTLIELLVVVAIISVLASLLLPSLSKAKSEARKILCMGNLRQLAIGHTTYTDESDGWFMKTGGSSCTNLFVETRPTTRKFYDSYLGGNDVLLCPNTQIIGPINTNHHPGYFHRNLGVQTSYRWPGARGSYGPATQTSIIANGSRSRNRPKSASDLTAGPSNRITWAGQLVDNYNNIGEKYWIHEASVQPMAYDAMRRTYVTWYGTAAANQSYNNHEREKGTNVVFNDGHAKWGSFLRDPPRMWLSYWQYYAHW